MITVKQSSKKQKRKKEEKKGEKKQAVKTVCKHVFVKVTKTCKIDQLK